MSLSSEQEVLDFLQREKELSKAKALIIFDRSGLVKLGSYEIPEGEADKIVNAFCRVAYELKEFEGSPGKGEGFLIGKLRNYLVYVAPVSSNMCLLGVFPESVNFLRLYQSMGVLSEVVKEKGPELEELLKAKKADFISRSEKEVTPSINYLAPYQVDAILEELRNEIGPAAEIIFKKVAKEAGLDTRRMTKEQAYEFVNRLAEKIGSLERKQKFLKVTYGIIGS